MKILRLTIKMNKKFYIIQCKCGNVFDHQVTKEWMKCWTCKVSKKTTEVRGSMIKWKKN